MQTQITELLEASKAMREAWENNLTEPMERLNAAIDAAEKLRADMTTDPERYAEIVKLAEPLCNDELEIDEGADLSEGDDNGIWIAAWVWVDFSGTPLDKEKLCECGRNNMDCTTFDGDKGVHADR